MLILQFLDALETLSERLNDQETLNIWLVIREQDQFSSIVGVLIDILPRLSNETIVVRTWAQSY